MLGLSMIKVVSANGRNASIDSNTHVLGPVAKRSGSVGTSGWGLIEGVTPR